METFHSLFTILHNFLFIIIHDFWFSVKYLLIVFVEAVLSEVNDGWKVKYISTIFSCLCLSRY